MSLKPFFSLLRDGRLGALLGVGAGLKSFYKLTYLAAAGEAGLLKLLAAGPATFDSLLSSALLKARAERRLRRGCRWVCVSGCLSLGQRGYAFRGLAKTLARPGNDPALAMVEEVAGLHHKLIAGTLPKIRKGDLWSLADQDGELIARSSRVLEAFQAEAIERVFPERGGAAVCSEIGCGSGVYLRYAARRNPALTAVGVELQPAVA